MLAISQEYIMRQWQRKHLPLVSILCFVYNHQSYLEEALQSLLCQETTFPFEIIVHDDASTDLSVTIIQRYAEKYHEIIRPIFQKQNQQSQKKKCSVLAFSQAKGKYIALCDGDDYWISNKKLAVQVAAMQSFPHCHLSFHPACINRVDGKKVRRLLGKHRQHHKIFSPQEIINGDGAFCPTASLLIHRRTFETLPPWFLQVPAGDYFLQILCSLPGGALYIDEVMSAYRVGAKGSWSERIASDEQLNFQYFTGMLEGIEHLNQYTHNQYQAEIQKWCKRIYVFMCRTQGISLQRRKQFFHEYKDKFNYKDKMMWHCIYKHRHIYNFLRRLKNRGIV